MNMRQKIELTLVFLAGTMVYLTFSPADERNFWQYWVCIVLCLGAQIATDPCRLFQAVVWFFLAFGYLFDVMFTPELSFVFDPNADVSLLFYFQCALVSHVFSVELEKENRSPIMSKRLGILSCWNV